MSEEQVAQWFSIVASIFIVFGYFATSDTKAKLIVMVGWVFFVIHFFMLGAMVAMVMNFINIVSVVFSIKFHKSIFLYGAFVVAYLVAGFVTYSSWIDVFPVIAATLGCTGMFLLSGIRFRFVMVVGGLCWMLHNAYVMSIGGFITDVFCILAHLTTIYRIHKREGAHVQKV